MPCLIVSWMLVRGLTVAPLVIGVQAAPDIPPAIVEKAIAEASAIWQDADLALQWQVVDPDAASPDGIQVRVVIGDAAGPAFQVERAIGWIGFDASGAPEPVIQLSRGNAAWLLASSRASRTVTLQEHEVLLGRALGRALAHELGHYLLASKRHTSAGLMRRAHSGDDFFSLSRDGFRLIESDLRDSPGPGIAGRRATHRSPVAAAPPG